MCVVVAAIGSASFVRADDTDTDAVQVHAFVSQGWLKSTDNNFLAQSSRGSFEFFEAGLNFTKQIDDRLRVGLQLFAQDLGPLGDYKAKVDWAYADYHYRDWLGLRIGRIKLPFGLYNDIADIDAAHPGALLPQSIYPATNRNFLLAQTGFELYGYRELGRRGGALDYRAYAGTIYLDLGTQPPGSPLAIVDLTIPYIAGGRVMWETPVEGLRIGASVQTLRLETHLLELADPRRPSPVAVNIPATLAVASAEYTIDDAIFAAEFSRWRTSAETSNPMVFPASPVTWDIRAYALMGYRLTPRLQPSVYYSIYYPDRQTKDMGAGTKQLDAAATLRVDISPNWILKLEGHWMRGTAALSTTLNPGRTLDTLADHWLLIVAKTTVYF